MQLLKRTFSTRHGPAGPALDKLCRQDDLTQRVNAEPQWLQTLDDFVERLESRIGASLRAAVGIASHARPLQTIAAETETHGQTLAQTSEMIASASEEVTATLDRELVPGSAQIARLASQVAGDLRQCSGESAQVLDQVATIRTREVQLSEEIRGLASQLDQVSQVIDLIANISQQTNLLALNAAIEAARAGEHGRGFAVVADEVRRLAGSTTDATGQVGTIIDSFRSAMSRLTEAGDAMHQAVDRGQEGMTQVNQGLANARQGMDQLDQQVATLASGTEQIGAAMRGVNGDVQQVAGIAAELMASASGVLMRSEKVRTEGDRLLEGLGGFKLDVHHQIETSVLALARMPALSASTVEAESLMRRTLAQDSRFELLYLVGRDGIQVTENIFAADVTGADKASAKGKNWRNRIWFQAVADTGQAYLSQVYRSAATDDFCLTLSAPVVNAAGELISVLGADIRLSALLTGDERPPLSASA